jgi:hypothetical protein
MSENGKNVKVPEGSTVRDRAEWHRPEFRKLDVSEAQATPASLTDSAVLS